MHIINWILQKNRKESNITQDEMIKRIEDLEESIRALVNRLNSAGLEVLPTQIRKLEIDIQSLESKMKGLKK